MWILNPVLCWAVSFPLFKHQMPVFSSRRHSEPVTACRHEGNHMKRGSLEPRLGWADLFVCFVCCFSLILFSIKAHCWIVFGAAVRNSVSKQRSLDWAFGFSDGGGYNFSCWQHWAARENYKRDIVPPCRIHRDQGNGVNGK